MLIISGFDGTSSAGIMLDSFVAKLFGAEHYCILPALTVQNHTQVINTHICNLEEQFLVAKTQVKYIKIGLLYNADIIQKVAQILQNKCPDAKIICDTPIQSSSGFSLAEDLPSYIDAFKKYLLPITFLLTPNAQEIAYFGSTQEILVTGCENILLKGGHSSGKSAVDILYNKDASCEFSLPRIATQNMNVRGTGCALSTAITCYMHMGLNIENAIWKAKEFVHTGIKNCIQVNSNAKVLHWPLFKP